MLDSDNQSGLLLFTVGPVHCVAEAVQVAAVIPPPRLSHLPGDAGSAGFFRHGHRMVRLIDVRERFGLDAGDAQRHRVIIVDTPEGALGYRVDRVDNVIERSEGRFGQTPRYVPRDTFPATFTRRDQLHLYVDLNRLWQLQTGHWLQESGLFAQTTVPAAPPSEPEATPTEAGSVSSTAPVRHARASDHPSVGSSSDRGAPSGREVSNHKAIRGAAPGTSASRRDSWEALAPHTEERGKSPGPAPGNRSTPAGSQGGAATGAGRRAGLPTSRGGPPEPAQVKRHAVAPVSNRSAHPPESGLETGGQTAPITIGSRSSRPPPSSPRHEDENGRDGGWAMVMTGIFLAGLLLVGLWLLFGQRGGQETRTATTPVPQVAPRPPATPSAPPAPVLPPEETTSPGGEIMEDSAPPVAILDQGGAADEGAAVSEPAETVSPSPLTRDGSLVTLILEEPVEGLGESAGEGAAALPETTLSAPQEAMGEPEGRTAQTPMHEGRAVKREIVHVVARGDTLWAIARRYLDDPYRYPELAKLSGIRDPDLIYPGDRVRILILQRTTP